MKDFEFSFPTQVVFGRGAEQRVGEFAAACRSPVMLLYGSDRVRRSGLLARLTASLEEWGGSTVEFGGIVENPLLSKAEEGVRLARETGAGLLQVLPHR